MTTYHFWRGNQIRLRAIEQKDLDNIAQSFEDLDTEVERYESEVPFPLSREQDRAGLEALRKREPGDDSFFWMIENLEGELVGYIHTFDCERRAGVFKYAIALRRPYWGRGYAREAITIVLRYYSPSCATKSSQRWCTASTSAHYACTKSSALRLRGACAARSTLTADIMIIFTLV